MRVVQGPRLPGAAGLAEVLRDADCSGGCRAARAVAPLCPPCSAPTAAPVPERRSSASPGAVVPPWGGLRVWGRSRERRGSYSGVGDPGQGEMGTRQCRQAGAEDLTCQPPAADQKLPLRQSELLSHLMGKVAAIWGLSNHCRAECWPQSGSRKGGGPGGASIPGAGLCPPPCSSTAARRPAAPARLGPPCPARTGGHPQRHCPGTDTGASL